jgi:hypothetical protein
MAKYPLGIFNGTGATTSLQPLKEFAPPVRLHLDYLRDAKGSPRGVVNVPGDGPAWLTGFISLPDRSGKPHLVASVTKIKPPMTAYKWVLCEWDEQKQSFEFLREIWTASAEKPKPPPIAEGHPVLWKQGTREWVLFGNPLPILRCPATYEAWQDPANWEVLKPQATLAAAGGAGEVKPHSGNIVWNPWRKRWVTVFMESLGKPTPFGELWYAEADSPLGPWGPAIKVLTHENYTFYNPRIHPEFTAADSPVLIFEGTYTMQFCDNKQPTPRYDYNQILYRLDLDDPRLLAAKRPNN